jgi:hypothetical protein
MADQTVKPAKPFVFPDMNNYVVPSVELLLIGGFGVILLNCVFGWDLLSSGGSAVATQNPAAAAAKAKLAADTQATTGGPIVQSGTIQSSTVPATAVAGVSGTHRVLCSISDQGLNFRPSAGFSTPLFAIPCGAIVNVTGAAVNVQNETWSPVNYAGRTGWAATKLLQPLR